MRVYVCADEWRVLEVFVNEQDAKRFQAEDNSCGEIVIHPRTLRTGSVLQR